MIAPRSTLPFACDLYHNGDFQMPELEPLLGGGALRLRPFDALRGDPVDCDRPGVLLVDRSLAERTNGLDALPDHVVVVAADAAAERALGDAADLTLVSVTDRSARLRVLRAAFQLSAARRNEARARSDLERSHRELAELNRIGMALMTQRNRDELLRQILIQVMRLTSSDAGALFLIERDEDGTEHLRFKLILAESVVASSLNLDETFPVDSTSVAGHVARTGSPLVIDDIRNLPKDAPFSVNPFAERRGYWIKSMLAIPMIDHRDEVVGVLQLANHKVEPEARILSREDAERYARPYSERDVQFSRSLAGQAAVLIENAQLCAQIDNLFECFVKSAVTAIEQRDPSTAGHSLRVATLVTDFAAALERSAGTYRNHRFTPAQMRELRYAALLHDFGKVGVSEEVLVKAKKLPPVLCERVDARFDLIRCSLELQFERNRARLRASRGDHQEARLALEAEHEEQLAQLERFRATVRAANEPSVLAQDTDGVLLDVARHTFELPDGRIVPYLAPNELHYLQIPRGNLDERERHEVETHAQQTFDFLSGIPWTDNLSNIAEYASGHHERLDGSGYPRHLGARSLPVQTRIMAIADIFDALTAADRPYKRAVSPEQALDILRSEAVAGLLDSDLVQALIESGVYRRILEEDWRRF